MIGLRRHEMVQLQRDLLGQGRTRHGPDRGCE